jgi:hypothetical protein
LIEWASSQAHVSALILGGSRARPEANADEWSDWDIHLLTSDPERYGTTEWLTEIAPCWCAHSGITPRGVRKISAVFAGGWEADFIPLAAWQMRLVYWAMKYPGLRGLMPERLRSGIHETRDFMLGSGYRLLAGDRRWLTRLESLQVDWPTRVMGKEKFLEIQSAFWTRAIWLCKRITRSEHRAAMYGMNQLWGDLIYPLLCEEARSGGQKPRPEARKAEVWLNQQRLKQTAFFIGPDSKRLADTLLSAIELFCDVTNGIAEKHSYPLPNRTDAEQWLRSELARITDRA